ncbi:iron-sulfur cluster assembly accessory protein [Rhizoclosmatium globosum]|uniref:Iron-sulfur cluster assembly accessory protein n=1 Tax=Rhizoclosmatium globosum TaxID=329046 RepID=A0A1Y2ARB7_9FUNG|nr:iron-sulfur cluster assembly accessory protein [Rhizoclosmatium globosum]|eukprot:ORY25103.1 iron-sulfur cluster assembly accessory protein [Rhizoclosmatium globosum]
MAPLMNRSFTTANTPGIVHIADSAAKRINSINAKAASNPPQAFRITVDSGGCHGYQYVMGLTKEINPAEDVVFEKDGAKVVVDKVSLDLCTGSTLEFVEELIGSSFQVVGNPKAETSCGCKISFNVN